MLGTATHTEGPRAEEEHGTMNVTAPRYPLIEKQVAITRCTTTTDAYGCKNQAKNQSSSRRVQIPRRPELSGVEPAEELLGASADRSREVPLLRDSKSTVVVVVIVFIRHH